MGMHERIGTSDTEAQEVQNLLYAAGYKVDNVKGYVTRAFVETLMRFQRDSAIRPTGEVDDLTMEALRFAVQCEPADYEIVLRGKRYLLSRGDYRILQRRICETFRKGAFHDMRWRVIEARTTYDTLRELSQEQYVVGWLIDAYTGATFPKEGPLKAAEGQLAGVEAALKSQDVKKLHAAIPPAEAQINKALAEIRAYRKTVIEGGGAWVSALDFTKTAAFTALGVMAGPAVATLGMGAVATGFVAGAGTAAVEAIAFEVGKGLAGTSQGAGAATANVLRGSFIGGTVGAIARGKYAEKIVKGVSGKVAARISSGWARGVAKGTVAKFTAKVLQNSTSNVLEGAMSDVLGQFKANPKKLTAEKFFDNLARNAAVGAVMGEFDKVFEPKAADFVRQMPGSARKELLKHLGDRNVDKALTDLFHKSASDTVKKAWEDALDSVLAGAKGTESPRELQKRAMERMFDRTLNQALIRIAVKNSRRGR